MAIVTPTINRIIRMTEFDLLRTEVVQGNMYMCTDSRKLWYDEGVNNRVVYNYSGVSTVNDLFYKITPAPNTTYYCWEDNSLWLWQNKWISLWTDKTYPSAYVYDTNKRISEVYRYDQPLMPADDNGLLHDGSVVVRDRNRIIKGKIFVDDGNDNLVISSFLGGGVRVLPNGKLNTTGEFYIDDEGKSFIRAEWNVKDNEGYVDYSEHPELDENDYPNPEHRYKVFHEGNLDISKVKEVTGLEIYTKLRTDADLPSPLDLNVSKLNGLRSTDLALKQHTHTAENITDFSSVAQSEAFLKIKEMFNHMDGEGIEAEFDTATERLLLSANNFNLTFTGGATGTGLIRHLADTSINLVIDGTKHSHQSYEDTMDSLQEQIDAIHTIDPDEYYKKNIVDTMIQGVTGTTTPVQGKPLVINTDGILDGTSARANALGHNLAIVFNGDITGNATTTFADNDLVISLSADNIVSSTAIAGKAVKVNSEGNLPVNATTASALNHNILLTLSGEASGEVDIDTSRNTATLNITLLPSTNILQDTDLGSRVASLGQDGKVPASQLPASQVGLVPMGNWNPNTGAPALNPAEGQFWSANTAGTFDGKVYAINDWCLYMDSQWKHIATSGSGVSSVNGETGDVLLSPSDVHAISDELIDYSLGDTIPANMVVRTSGNGVIQGASVRNLTNAFNLVTDATGDIQINTEESTAIGTDGSSNIDVKLEITNAGMQRILNEASYTIYNGGAELSKKPILNFTNGISAIINGNRIDISADGGSSGGNIIYWDGLTLDTDVVERILSGYNTRATKPMILMTYKDNRKITFVIDGNAPDLLSGTFTVTLYGEAIKVEATDSNGVETIQQSRYKTDIVFTGASEIDRDIIAMTLSNESTNVGGGYLATDIDSTTIPFVPTYNAHPTTKKYVDDNIFNSVTGAKSELRVEFLGKSNADPYTPTANYHPATKKYVDDNKGLTTVPNASSTTVGGITMRLVGTTLYIRNDGGQA